MKKLLCLILSSFMLYMPAYADEIKLLGAIDKELLFDLDISEYSESNLKVSDKSGKNEIVTLRNKPEAKSELINQNEVKYVEFNSKSNDIISNFRLAPANVCGLENSTVEIWASPSETDENVRTLFSVSKIDFESSVYYAGFSGNTMTVFANGISQECDISEYIGKWSHYVFVRSYKDGKICVYAYINSKKVITIESEGEKQSESDKYFYIGAPGNFSTQLPHVFRGGVSEARIYGTAFSEDTALFNYIEQAEKYGLLSPEEPDITDPPENEGELLFDLEVDKIPENSKDKADSTVTFSNNEDVTSGSFMGIEGNFDYLHFKDEEKTAAQYLQFDGKNIKNKDSLSIECWARPNDIGTGYGNIFVFTNSNSANAFLRLSCFENKISFMENSGTAQRVDVKGDSYVGKWNHFVVIRNYNSETSEVELSGWINGKKVIGNSTPYKSKVDETEAKYGIGGVSKLLIESFIGDIAEFKVYGKELTSEEIQENYKKNLDKYTAPSFFYDSSIPLPKDSDVVKMTVANGILVSELIAKGITVSNAETGKQIYTLLGDTDDESFTLNFRQYLKYGMKLKLYSDSLDIYNNIETERGSTAVTASLHDENGVKITRPDGQEKLKINLTIKNNGSKDKEYRYAVIAKNENNASVSALSGKYTISAEDYEKSILTLLNTKNALKLYIYVWEADEVSLTSVYDMPIKIE